MVPVVFGVILLASFIFKLFPALAVLASGDHDDVATVVQVIEGIACL